MICVVVDVLLLRETLVGLAREHFEKVPETSGPIPILLPSYLRPQNGSRFPQNSTPTPQHPRPRPSKKHTPASVTPTSIPSPFRVRLKF